MAAKRGKRKGENRKDGTGSIGIDVGGTKTLFALFDSKFNVFEEIKIKTHDCRNAKEFGDVISESVKVRIKKAKKAGVTVEGVGIGCAGSLTQNGNVKESANIPFLKGFSFQPIISRRTDANLVLLNDAAAGIYGEHQLGVARPSTRDCYLRWNRDRGALIIDGKLYRGADANAGDIGHYFVFRPGRAVASMRIVLSMMCRAGRRSRAQLQLLQQRNSHVSYSSYQVQMSRKSRVRCLLVQ